MKKLGSLIILFVLLIYINACAGYKPIYRSSNSNFIIEDHSIKGEERLANSIYIRATILLEKMNFSFCP